MGKLYKLKRGGMGTFEEAWKENFVDTIRFLTFEEVILLSSRLRNTRQIHSDDNQRLREAEAIISKERKLTANELEEALNTVADIAYSKLSAGSEDLEEAAEEIIEDFKKKAINRGYKEN